MKIDPRIRTYGDLSYRGTCPTEDAEAQTFVNQLRKRYPELIFTHIKNEGKRTKMQADFDKSMGMQDGMPDFIIMGCPPLPLEMKRKDSTKSRFQPNQEKILLSLIEQGCPSCVCFGWEAAMQAVEDWISIKK